MRQLLAHTSGLYDYVDDARVFAPCAQAAAFAPGERYAYSSTDQLLLGLIAEAATGKCSQRSCERASSSLSA